LMASMTLLERFRKSYRANAHALEKKGRAGQYLFISRTDKIYLAGKAVKLLDVGCGNGSLDSLLSKKYDVTGIDTDKKALDAARKNVPRAKFIWGDMRTFRSGERYDIIVASDSIDHGDELMGGFEKTLQNLGAQLNNRGALIFDLLLVKELWARNDTVTSTFKHGGERYIRVLHRELEHATGMGISYQVITLIKGNTVCSEASHIGKTAKLLKLKKIVRAARKLGFRFFLYDGWQNKPIKTVGKEPPVCVLVKSTQEIGTLTRKAKQMRKTFAKLPIETVVASIREDRDSR